MTEKIKYISNTTFDGLLRSLPLILAIMAAAIWMNSGMNEIQNKQIIQSEHLKVFENKIKEDFDCLKQQIGEMKTMRWSSYHMQLWAQAFAQQNSGIVVPDPSETAKYLKDLK